MKEYILNRINNKEWVQNQIIETILDLTNVFICLLISYSLRYFVLM